MGLGGLEPPTSRLSGVRSNQLSYRPTTSERSRGSGAVVSRARFLKALPRNDSKLEPSLALHRRDDSSPIGRKSDQARSQPQAPEREKNSARTGKSGRST